MPESPNLFLKKKYNLHSSPEVESAVQRKEAITERQTGQKDKVLEDPSARIQNYLDRFKEITERKDPAERERGLEALKRLLHTKFVIKPQDVPESTFLLEQRLARELGHGDVEITAEFKTEKTEQIINGQKQSLDRWIDYLSSPDAQYPDWAKYWALRSVLEMGKLQKKTDIEGKETVHFQKRTKDTTASFPTLNPGALAPTIGAVDSLLREKTKPKTERKDIKNTSIKLNDEDFKSLIATENFAKIYTQFLIEMPAYSTEGLQEIRGNWIKYPQDSKADALVDSLAGHPLEWCTKDLATAQQQLRGGDFYVYYSLDNQNQPTTPRVAIRMEGNKITEVRGIAPEQNIDPYIAPVVQTKMKEFPDGQQYEKKANDMKTLTILENKTKTNQPLSKDELIFLYEMNSPIEGFGLTKDPRIKELRSQRNPKEDAPVVFDCKPEQIARNQAEINQNTKAYVGPLFKDIFKTLNHLDHIYTSFPEGKISQESIKSGGKTVKQLETELTKANIQVHQFAQQMMRNKKEFITSKEPEQIDLVRLKVQDLFPNAKQNPTTDQIYEKAQELGLELCPAEVGHAYRLAYTPNGQLKKEQPMNEWVSIAMKQITDSDGHSCVFRVGRDEDGVWLDDYWADPRGQWDPRYEFVFRLSK